MLLGCRFALAAYYRAVTLGRLVSTGVVLMTLVVGLVACSDILTLCQSEVYVASKVSSLEDDVEDLDGAFEACASLEEFERAAGDFPDALDGASPAQFVANRCAVEPALAETSLCEDLLE